MTTHLSKEFLQECRSKLLQTKQDLLNRVRMGKLEFDATEKFSGDEIDQSVSILIENTFLISQERLRKQIMEIELALARMEMGTYGLCEETEEPIEQERLQAIPWTRLSIEGAEIREAIKTRYAR